MNVEKNCALLEGIPENADLQVRNWTKQERMKMK